MDGEGRRCKAPCPSGQPQLSLGAAIHPTPKETPVQAARPAGPSKTECRVVASSWSLSMNGQTLPRPLRQEHSHFLTHFNVPGTGHLPVPTAQMSLKIPGMPLQGSPSRDPGDSQHSFSQHFSASYAPLPPQGGATQKAKPLGNEFLGPFCTFAHGVTTRGQCP